MTRKIGEHREGDVTVRWFDHNDGNVTVEHSQDAQSALDFVAAENAEGPRVIDGLGAPIAMVVDTIAMDYARERGIAWEKFLYSREYEPEFRRFLKVYPRLKFEYDRKYHAVRQ